MIKAIVNHTGHYQGYFFAKGEETVLPEDAVLALGEDNVEVLDYVDEPKKDNKGKKEEKELDGAPQDKQVKNAVVNK